MWGTFSHNRANRRRLEIDINTTMRFPERSETTGSIETRYVARGRAVKDGVRQIRAGAKAVRASRAASATSSLSTPSAIRCAELPQPRRFR